MKFDWRKFTEADYHKYLEKRKAEVFDCHDYIGAVHIGDISIDLIDRGAEGLLGYDFYVAHEDTGYGYKDDVLPYDHADGEDMAIPFGLSYSEFKARAEKLFEGFIVKCDKCRSWSSELKRDVEYSLVEHASRPLLIW